MSHSDDPASPCRTFSQKELRCFDDAEGRRWHCMGYIHESRIAYLRQAAQELFYGIKVSNEAPWFQPPSRRVWISHPTTHDTGALWNRVDQLNAIADARKEY